MILMISRTRRAGHARLLRSPTTPFAGVIPPDAVGLYAPHGRSKRLARTPCTPGDIPDSALTRWCRHPRRRPCAASATAVYARRGLPTMGSREEMAAGAGGGYDRRGSRVRPAQMLSTPDATGVYVGRAHQHRVSARSKRPMGRVCTPDGISEAGRRERDIRPAGALRTPDGSGQDRRSCCGTWAASYFSAVIQAAMSSMMSTGVCPGVRYSAGRLLPVPAMNW